MDMSGHCGVGKCECPYIRAQRSGHEWSLRWGGVLCPNIRVQRSGQERSLGWGGALIYSLAGSPENGTAVNVFPFVLRHVFGAGLGREDAVVTFALEFWQEEVEELVRFDFLLDRTTESREEWDGEICSDSLIYLVTCCTGDRLLMGKPNQGTHRPAR